MTQFTVLEKFFMAANAVSAIAHIALTQPKPVGLGVGVAMLGITAYGYVAKRTNSLG